MLTLSSPCAPVRHRDAGRHGAEGAGLQGEEPEAGPVQPGSEHRLVEGQGAERRTLRALRELPGTAHY